MVESSRLVNLDQLKSMLAEMPLSVVAEKLCDVELTKSGSQFKGLCPLHQEDTPSFFVNDTKGGGVFHCWGCKRGGDAITLVREVHSLDFHGALAKLAELAEIDISEFERPATAEEKARDELRAWCEKWLMHGKRPTDRIKDADLLRGYDVITGYPPARVKPPPAMPGYFKDKDYLFRGVIFPYRDTHGRLTGWKARKPDKQMFATPADFPLAAPAIFGLYQALPHIEQGRLILVEGEYDALTLAEHGVRNVAAIGGSRFTDEMMAILEQQKIREIVFWLDGDEGGQSAAESIARRFWSHPTIRVRIKVSAAGADPEDMVRTLGASTVAANVEVAQGALEWLLWEEWASQPRNTLSDKLDFVTWIIKTYGDKLRGLQEALVLREVAGWMGVPEAEVLDFAQQDKTLLQAVDSEKVLLGKSCRDSGYYLSLRKRLRTEDFYVLKHQRLWEVLGAMLVDGLTDFEATVIRRRAENEGVDPEYVEALMVMGETNIGWHEDQVLDYSIRRTSQADADRFRTLIADPNVPANQAIGVLTHRVTSKALGRATGAFRPLSEQVDEAMDTLHERMRNPDAIHGLDLGSQFPGLSRMIQGLQPRRLVCLASTSGVGKTTMTLQWCTQLAVGLAVPVDFITLEMDADEIVFKMAAHMTGIDGMRITGGRITEDEATRIEQAMAMVRKSPLRVYAPDGITPSEFVLYARESVMERRTEVFVVDYAQMVGPDPGFERESRYEQLRHFAYMCKQKVARGLDTTVVCPAQLNRAAAEKERPTKEDMGDSYEIVRASDVIFILKGDEDSTVYDFIIDKNRQGPGNQLFPVEFRRAEQTFREANSGARDPDYRVIE